MGKNDERRIVLGVDIGGSGMKGAPIDIDRGELIEKRLRIPTPNPSTPEAVARVFGKIVDHFSWKGPVGAAFPAVMKNGVAHSAANIEKTWIGTNAQQLFEKTTGCAVRMLNDADAAGNAEMRFGTGKDVTGVVMMLTFGTGIGSALYIDGKLVPNTELGHLEFRGMEAEHYAAERIRDEEDLSWDAWGERVDEFLNHINMLFSPDLIILGGGVSKKYEKYIDEFTVPTKFTPAKMRNEAGIIGAALEVSDLV